MCEYIKNYTTFYISDIASLYIFAYIIKEFYEMCFSVNMIFLETEFLPKF